MSDFYEIGKQSLSLLDVSKILSEKTKIKLSQISKKRVERCRKYLDKKMKDSASPVYGVNTGFGSLCNRKISNNDIEKLQKNLVLSHACGIGDEVPYDIIKIMILLKSQSLSYGYSGICVETIERLTQMFNHDVLPVVYEQGSLGASGDLAPLAHLSLPLLGEGEVYVPRSSNDDSFKRIRSSSFLKQMGWNAINLRSKEGLALLNGTQFMSSYGVWALLKSKKLSYFSDLISAISLEAFDCRLFPFDKLVHSVRPYKGHSVTSSNIRKFLEGSSLQREDPNYVQDPYSFRCIPQVHGSAKDVIDHVGRIFFTEINSVSDNPIIFPSEDRIISGGNFHGQSLSMSMDYLSIAVAELGSISERRIYKLISGERNLPEFLTSDIGLNSGMMILQYTAASIVSQNKQLCTPSSIDSIVSSNGQEDHVSMGANAATKLYKVVNNLERILAIELMVAIQARSFRTQSSSLFIDQFIDQYRSSVKFLDNDRILSDDIKKSLSFIQNFDVDYDLL